MFKRMYGPNSFLARYWFPAALIAMLLLAIPGFILFGLNLSGWEGAVNRYLENTYQLSYHIGIPWWGGLILLLVPIAILVLYFLKLKRKALSVPSTFLWRKSIEDLHVNSLLQWLRQNVLLLLQLLAVLAMLYGIMAFRFHGNTGAGKHYIVMIDNSASMSSTDVSPNRLEWAKEEALKEIDACTDNDVGMVLVFNSSAEILQSYTNNRDLIRQAVRNVQPTQRPTRIEEALSLADSQANPTRSTEDVASRPANEEPGKERSYAPAQGVAAEVHLYSDGRFPAVPEFALGNLNLHYHAAGKLVLDAATPATANAANPGLPVLKPDPDSADNVALVTFNAVRDESDATKLEVFVRVMNFRSRDTTVVVQLSVMPNGVFKNLYEKELLLDARKVTTEGDPAKEDVQVKDEPGENSATFSLPDIDDKTNLVLHAKLKDVGDKFPLDDEAWLVVGAPRKARVLIVGNTNDLLDKFFDADEVRDVATVDRLAPEDLAKDAYLGPARNGRYDLVIFDRCGPAAERDMPRSNTFFIGYPPPPWKRDELETVEDPHVTGWMSKHRILHDLTALYTLEVYQSFKLKDLPPRTPLLIEGRKIMPERSIETALLVALNRQSFTDLVMTFPILNDKGQWNTTWPVQTSFPLFMRNVLYNLGNLSETAAEETVQPGQVKAIRPEGSPRRIDVAGPDGKERTLVHEDRDLRTDFSYGATDRIGVYWYKWDGKPQGSFAVNLLDADESNIEPRPTVQIGNERVTSGEARSQPRELWKWFAGLALLILMVEWYIYNKRIYI
jgi:hypothetical protein